MFPFTPCLPVTVLVVGVTCAISGQVRLVLGNRHVSGQRLLSVKAYFLDHFPILHPQFFLV